MTAFKALVAEVVGAQGRGREAFDRLTAARAELFARLETPKSIKGWKKKPT